jgi:hypothetical protein
VQQYVRVEKGRLENAERRAGTFMNALIDANEKNVQLRKAITEALYDYDHGDELSAIDRLRAALAK